MRNKAHAHDLVHLSVQVPERVLGRLEATAYEQGVRLPEIIAAMLELGLDTHNGQEVRRAA